MKTILSLLAILTTAASHAANVTVTWDANPPGEPVTGYRLYWGQAAGRYTASNAVAGTSCTLSNLVGGQKYYFAVTAYNADTESAPSPEVAFTLPLTAPKNIRIEIVVQAAATPRGPWRDYVSTVAAVPERPGDSYLRTVVRALPE